MTSNHFKKLKIHLRSNIILLQYLLVHILHYIRSFWNDHVFGTLQVIIHPRYLKIIWKICCSLHAFLRPRGNKNSKIRWSNHQAITLITNHNSPLKNMLYSMPLSESFHIVRGENQMNCDRKIMGITFTISYSSIVTNWFLHTNSCKSQRWGFRVRNWARTTSIPLSKTRNKLKRKVIWTTRLAETTWTQVVLICIEMNIIQCKLFNWTPKQKHWSKIWKGNIWGAKEEF